MSGPARALPSDRIELRGIRAYGFHGVLPHERRDGQPFVVDVVAWLDLAPAAASDALTDTVDYGALAADIVAAVERNPVDLIETVAGRIADVVLTDPRVDQVEVTVHKPEAPVTVAVADLSVVVVRGRP
jgi:7,8-dihydroneopterin aldolase/epimerase/oxygenase